MIEIFNWMEKKDHAKIMIDKVIMNSDQEVIDLVINYYKFKDDLNPQDLNIYSDIILFFFLNF